MPDPAPHDDSLTTPAQFAPSVGPRRAPLLEKLGLHTVEDILWYLPRDVLDLTDLRAVQQLEEGIVQTVHGVVVDLDARQLARGKTMAAALLDCEGQYLRGTWFNQPWMLSKFEHGQHVLFSGKPKKRGGRWEMSHPQIQWLDDDPEEITGGLLPRYGLTEGLKMYEMRRITKAAVEKYVDLVPDSLPNSLRETLQLPDLKSALRSLHSPTDRESFDVARHRLIFDDLFVFQLALALRRRYWRNTERAPKLPTSAKIDARIRRLFPFRFTAGQDTAVTEIVADLDSGRTMHRLLQADVGAGKTAVALYAMLVAIAAGHQTVLMAPTEVLALQHWQTVEQALAHSRVERLLLTGQLTAKQRKAALERISTGDVQLIIGTQAVIQKDVTFKNIGLAVIDEQHKFGVGQRSHFSQGETSPHVLVMTATPIPRSLCLTQFGDLDLTTITELPPGRQRIVTSRVPGPAAREKAWGFIQSQLQAGRQAYVVCPRIEEADTNDDTETGELPTGAEEVFRRLRDAELQDFTVGLVHGRMSREEKSAAMDAFRDGSTQVLVSTTVVEVGIDVPNATLMIIFHAGKFGLSQLHQLRGRIARGEYQGYCFLFIDLETEDGSKRLAALEATSDGFEIAEADFEQRGPGDVLGSRQHGELPLKVADLVRDKKLLEQARKQAFDLVAAGTVDGTEFSPLKIEVLERFGELLDLPKSG
jgi:ATP-dependent DNA helicase RecG